MITQNHPLCKQATTSLAETLNSPPMKSNAQMSIMRAFWGL